MLLTAALTPLPRRSTDRRFERRTLIRLLPFFALYLLLSALWPLDRPLEAWHGVFGLTSRLEDTSLHGMNARIEYLVAFTVLGYLSAEWRGRSELPLMKDLPRLILTTTVTALTLEILVGFQSGAGASLVRFVMVIASALFGGLIYHLLRAHIRLLLSRDPAPTPTRPPQIQWIWGRWPEAGGGSIAPDDFFRYPVHITWRQTWTHSIRSRSSGVLTKHSTPQTLMP